jgi:glycosyltransferase involved in cell wall biosynthesis
VPGEPFTFGYIGTHIPAKGIHLLIDAFGRLEGDCRLRIWGRDRGQDSRALRALADALPPAKRDAIEWESEYRNERICADVFDRVDAIVTPSIWVENAPLVIHEAQEARVPVVTADVGGMAEYVAHEVNGLLFRHRDAADMAVQMQRLLDDPALAARLGARGYLEDPEGRIPEIDAHCAEVERLYARAVAGRAA